MPERYRRFIAVLCVILAVGAGSLYNDVIKPQLADQTPTAETKQETIHDPSTGLASTVLQTLPIKGRAPKTGYSRDQFGEGWDTVNGCSVRNIILRRDLQDAVLDPANNCAVESGTLHDQYTSKIIAFQRGADTSDDVQIDHMVALSDAWQKGAQQISRQEREALANDPLNLMAVDGPANQQKSDADAATWLPPNKGYRCRYVARQIAVKAKYRLWVTKAEHDAMDKILKGCPGQVLPVVGAEATKHLP